MAKRVTSTQWFIWASPDTNFATMQAAAIPGHLELWASLNEAEPEIFPFPEEPEQTLAQQALDLVWGALHQIRLLTLPLYRNRLRVAVRKDIAEKIQELVNEGQAHLLTIKEEQEGKPEVEVE